MELNFLLFKFGYKDGQINIEIQIIFFNFKLIHYQIWKDCIKKEFQQEMINKQQKSNKKKFLKKNLNLSEDKSSLFQAILKQHDCLILQICQSQKQNIKIFIFFIIFEWFFCEFYYRVNFPDQFFLFFLNIVLLFIIFFVSFQMIDQCRSFSLKRLFFQAQSFQVRFFIFHIFYIINHNFMDIFLNYTFSNDQLCTRQGISEQYFYLYLLLQNFLKFEQFLFEFKYFKSIQKFQLNLLNQKQFYASMIYLEFQQFYCIFFMEFYQFYQFIRLLFLQLYHQIQQKYLLLLLPYKIKPDLYLKSELTQFMQTYRMIYLETFQRLESSIKIFSVIIFDYQHNSKQQNYNHADQEQQIQYQLHYNESYLDQFSFLIKLILFDIVQECFQVYCQHFQSMAKYFKNNILHFKQLSKIFHLVHQMSLFLLFLTIILQFKLDDF